MREVDWWDPQSGTCGLGHPLPTDSMDADDTVLMQYTGLKDKTGKEVFEGDIITCGATQRETNDVIEKHEKIVVSYKSGYFYPFGYNCGWRSSVYDVEVIGNIHEHPHLLTNKE